MFILFY